LKENWKGGGVEFRPDSVCFRGEGCDSAKMPEESGENFTTVCIEEVVSSSDILLSLDPTTLATLQDDRQNIYL